MKALIVSLSSKNVHKALSPWCLKGYCDKFCDGVAVDVLEQNINENIDTVLQNIYNSECDVAGFSCYIWNIEYISKLCVNLRKVLPDIKIILGGPEVSFTENINDYLFADYIISGAGEECFCKLLLDIKDNNMIENKIIKGCQNSFDTYPSPFTDSYFLSFSHEQIPQIENRLVYYESSRGCPFSCAYCLSSVQDGVQYLPFERIKSELLLLIHKGAKCIKFVDRTFNADRKRASQILEFIKGLDTDCVFHFEAAADWFDKTLLELIKSMPKNNVQFEIGIQSVNEQTLIATQRKTNTQKSLDNIAVLSSYNNCHVHVDLIAGLPHETIESFAKGINECIKVRPHMLQLGFLKMLNGTGIKRNAQIDGSVYSDFAPYEILHTKTMSYKDLRDLKEIEVIIDKYYNSGFFANSVAYAIEKLYNNNAYKFFKELSIFLKSHLYSAGQNIPPKKNYTLLYEFLLGIGADKEECEHYIKLDCFSFNQKFVLPDMISPSRDKHIEMQYKKTNNLQTDSIRAEFFEFDTKTRIFNYDQKDLIAKSYKIIEL